MMKNCLLVLTACFVSFLANAQISAASQWTWVKGDNTANIPGVYGTKGTAAPTNKPGAREGSASWKDAAGNLWLFGGVGYADGGNSYLNDLWKYDVSTNQWTWVKGDNTINNVAIYGTIGVESSSNQPGARRWAASWTDAAGNFWLFGGNGLDASTSGQLNDLWRYNPFTNAWTWIKGDNVVNAAGVYGTQGVAGAVNKPGGRFDAASWVDAAGNFWVFGGRGYEGVAGSTLGNLNDLWKYNPVTNQWTWVNGDNGRNAASVYGTQGTPSATNKPGGRYGSISWTDANGNLWLFGGEQYFTISFVFNTFNDLWRYNPTTNQWTWMKGDNTANNNGVYGVQGMADVTNKPGARHKGNAWRDAAGNLWLFGGQLFQNSSGTVQDEYNDLWKYDVLLNQWIWVKGDVTRNSYGTYGTQNNAATNNKPGARFSHASWTDNAGNFWLFGGSGYAATTSGELNDLWKLSTSVNGPLPITLLTISATPKNNIVDVAWQTSQETNSSHFVLERSTDGRTFSSLGTVTAVGNSSSFTRYSFTDVQPFGGTNYYRIKMIDQDGTFVYSATIKTVFKAAINLFVYPNPVLTRTTVVVSSDRNLPLSLKLYDAGGKLYRTLQRALTTGRNTFALDLTGLPKGVYVAIITCGEDRRSMTIVKE